MLPIEFFGQNFHFALDLFFSLVCFATFWLYFDAWLVSKQKREVYKWLGFLLLSASFLLQSTLIETSILGESFFGNYAAILAIIIRSLGYLTIIISLITDPILKAPKTEGIKLKTAGAGLALPNYLLYLKFLLPLEVLGIALLYYQRSTTGLERHLKQIALSFFFLALSESLFLATLLRNTSNVEIFNLSAAFGVLWILEQFFLLLAAVLLGRWVWSYLVERIQSQLFMIFTTSVLVIFLIVSISFTFLLVSNIQKDSLSNLEIAAKVLNYSLDSKKAEIAAKAQSFAQNPDISKIINKKPGEKFNEKDHDELVTLLGNSLAIKQTSSITLTDSTGKVLAKAEEPDIWGNSISSDPLLRQALAGKESSNLTVKEGEIAPTIYLQSADPILKDSKVIGTVVVGLALSNNFLDGIKNSTGLESSIYAGNQRSSTTLLSQDGKKRLIGVKEENSSVKNLVLTDGKTFKGQINILNQPFLAVYQPLKNINNQVIGMSFTGERQVLILKDAGRSVQLIFLLSNFLLVISIAPSLLISRYISRQLS